MRARVFVLALTSCLLMMFASCRRADLRRLGLPPARAIDPQHASPGWYAISESIVMPAQVRDPSAYAWLTEGRAFERIGQSIRLYRVE